MKRERIRVFQVVSLGMFICPIPEEEVTAISTGIFSRNQIKKD